MSASGVLIGFYPSMVFIVLVYNSDNQIALINDWYACLQVLSKQLYVLLYSLDMHNNNITDHVHTKYSYVTWHVCIA